MTLHKLLPFSPFLLLIGYCWYVIAVAWIETRTTQRVDFFTCDRHGAFPSKLLISIDIGDGRPPVMQCPWCLEAAYKTADARLKAEEQKRQPKAVSE